MKLPPSLPMLDLQRRQPDQPQEEPWPVQVLGFLLCVILALACIVMVMGLDEFRPESPAQMMEVQP